MSILPPANPELAEAFKRVLVAVAEWRREAINSPEYEQRDQFLLQLEEIGIAAVAKPPKTS